MRNVRTALFAVIVLAGTAAYATGSGIEVLRVSGIEVLTVETHSTGAPLGSFVKAVVDVGQGPVVVGLAPVNAITGNATVIFPINHPSARVELWNSGVMLDYSPLTQWE